MTVDKAFAPQTWRLLVLDDERDVGQTIVTMARSAGVEAKAVTEAEDFFSQLDAYRPTHVAIDLMMPSLDGIGVIRQLADTHADVSVIIISGASARVLEAAKRSATEHGLSVAGILTKPFSRQALVATLEMQAASIAPESHPRDRQSGGALEARLVAALAEDRIGIALQPKVALESGELIGFEALARWQNDGIAVSPDQFVVVAEKAGMIDALTRTVLGKAVRWLARQEHSGSLTVAVNVSARSLKGDALLQMIDATCRDHHLSPERLIVELTESEAVGDQTDALDTITQLRLRRIALAIDDFGVGYSSLVQLARLPFSELKIDRRFVSDLTVSHESHAIVAAIIGMARGLELRTVAEAVEDLETYNLLKSMGCYSAQGYFIGRPMSPEDAAKWIVG